MRVLVAGGAGFLGSHLSEKLLTLGNEVMVVDNFYTGQLSNIEHLLDDKNFKLIRHDIISQLSVDVDAIYNLACPASPVHYQQDPVQTIKTCIIGSINLLDLARETGARILQASTSEIYGDPTISPQHEEYWGNVNSIGIRSCYDEGKRAAETLFSDYRRQYKVNTKIARIFNTYGPRMALDDGRVVSNFIVQALQNKPITIYGNGIQTRSFCYVDELIQGLIKLLGTEYEIAGPVNIGNPVEFTILELAKLVVELTNSNSKLIFSNLPSDDPKQRKPDIFKAKTLLNWEPKVQLKEGLLQAIPYFHSKLDQLK